MIYNLFFDGLSTGNQMNPEVIADRLHSVAVHLLRNVRSADRLSSMNAPRLSALSVLVFGGPITLGELAAEEQVRPPTMTRIVQALVKQGLVAKKTVEADRRRILLSATSNGKKQLLMARKRRIKALARKVDSLTGPEQAVLQEAVTVLTKMLQTGLS
jgi:DNA-binding MarR family transcriptional regulator